MQQGMPFFLYPIIRTLTGKQKPKQLYSLSVSFRLQHPGEFKLIKINGFGE
ncbi:hypothetical protein [Paenibacillus sp. RC67]|uniref:hypothetical protein n=1 Tax=Paenibacillus sp. RC67 TaxID=3039392 RepID=UPI0024AD3DFE|nr:hypothetical protein [Paenibacillus sp. RC67]